MQQIITLALSTMLIAYGNNALFSNVLIAELPECVVTTHCVRVNWVTNDPKLLFNNAVEAVTKTPRTKIVEQSDSYLHAEATSKWMHYVDDLEIQVISNKKILQIRSESRVGVGDKGVNKKRVEALEAKLRINHNEQ